MRLNFVVKISQIARLTANTKKTALPTFARNFKIPLNSCLPRTSNSGERLFRDEFKFWAQKCQIHVTSPKNVPVILVLALRYLAKAVAIASGRQVRKWWRSLTPEEKYIVLSKIRSKKNGITMVGVSFIGAVILYYYLHIVEDPITKRKKFILLNQKQIREIAEREYLSQREMFQNHIIPSYHPLHKRVTRVLINLLSSNKDIPEIWNKEWSVTVVDRPDITNAFALPQGKIFVFTGMLNVCTNEDQLAFILAHEISHSILFHSAELLSKVFFIDFLLLIPSILFWAVLSDGWAAFSDIMTSKISQILIQLPFTRSIEKEADSFGLKLMAKSCYDIREAPIFYSKMKKIGTDMPIEWLSTHPKHESRQQDLTELLPKAMELRNLSNCPPLTFKNFRF